MCRAGVLGALAWAWVWAWAWAWAGDGGRRWWWPLPDYHGALDRSPPLYNGEGVNDVQQVGFFVVQLNFRRGSASALLFAKEPALFNINLQFGLRVHFVPCQLHGETTDAGNCFSLSGCQLHTLEKGFLGRSFQINVALIHKNIKNFDQNL